MAAVACAMLAVAPAESAQVRSLGALHRDGQTFLTWTCPPGVGWIYHIYRSSSAIQSSADLAAATRLGFVSDSSWCDRRLSRLSGSFHGYVVDSGAVPLDSTRGLFVWTADAVAPAWYAVTPQSVGQGENTTVTPGGNSLVAPVEEIPALPRPVHQRRMIGQYGLPADVYTLWTGDRATPFAPAMANRPSVPYDCSLRRSGIRGSLLFAAHVRGGSFYLAQLGTGVPDEWVLTMDDYLPTPEANTFWFGYHEDYELLGGNVTPPTTGVVADYTTRRTAFTLEWALRTFPIDRSRVYVTGGSMGGIAGVFLAMWRPDLIAAVMADVPLFDFSFMSDPNPSSFNEGGRDRRACDRLWGRVATGLLMEDGTPVYERLNAGAMARSLEARHVPPIIAFNGRRDSTVGWAEKIHFYRAMRESRAGGTFFWDSRGHGATAGAWFPMEKFAYVSRFRTNLSFPALSNCSADSDPGDGHAAVGDSIGTINGFLEWDPRLVDEPGVWRVRMTLRDLSTLWGTTVRAPDSLTVDVTPRRLQRYVVTPVQPWRVIRLDDGVVVQTGMVAADALGLVTIPAVKVYRSGSVLEVGQLPDAGIGAGSAPDARPRIESLPSPLQNACTLAIEWPHAGDARVTVLDIAGRRVRTIFRGQILNARQELPLDPAGLPGGAYFLHAAQGSATAVRRFVVMR